MNIYLNVGWRRSTHLGRNAFRENENNSTMKSVLIDPFESMQ